MTTPNSNITTCTICNNKVAKTKVNPDGTCPAYSCPNNTTFYEQNDNTEAHKKRLALTEKYKSLYFCSPADYTLHFLYGLDSGNMLFISDTTYTQYIYNEDELDELAKQFPDNNYQKLKSSWK